MEYLRSIGMEDFIINKDERKDEEIVATIEKTIADITKKRKEVLNGLLSVGMTKEQVDMFAELFGWQ